MKCQQCRVNGSCRRSGAEASLPEAEYQIALMGAVMFVCTAHKSAFERRMRRAGRNDFKIFILPQNGQEVANADARS